MTASRVFMHHAPSEVGMQRWCCLVILERGDGRYGEAGCWESAVITTSTRKLRCPLRYGASRATSVYVVEVCHGSVASLDSPAPGLAGLQYHSAVLRRDGGEGEEAINRSS